MTAQNSLRLKKIELQNFRCFEVCELVLNDKLTVLVAENGRGKTALLDIIGISLASVVDAFAKMPLIHLAQSDVRLTRDTDTGLMMPHLPTSFSAQAVFSESEIEWKRELTGYNQRAKASFKGTKKLQELISRHKETDLPTKTLPLIAFYGTGRLWSHHRLTEGKKKEVVVSDNRFSGYIDCLSSSSSFRGMVSWYESKWNAVRDPRFSSQQAENIALLRAVQEATKKALEPTGWYELDWDAQNRVLVVKNNNDEIFPLNVLSDGIRNMTALTADVARRCATLNPHFGEDAAKKTPGILLIDEIDMHLHPRWQQRVVGLLQEAFPSLQIILSTHSPQVLSSVSNESIRIVSVQDSNGVIETPYSQTRGVKSTDLLAEIMDVDPIPEVPEASDLSKYQALIEDGKSNEPETLALRQKLIAHFGETHPVILECDRLIRFQEFKLRKQKEPNQ